MGGRRPNRIEPEFAQWMRSHLGYQASDTNVPLLIGSGEPARFVSVRGETYGAAWRRLRFAAFIVFAAAIAHRSVVAVPEGEIPIVPTVLSYLAIAAYLAARLGRMRTRQYTWVECKARRMPISREAIVTLSDTVKNVRESQRASWKPAHVLFVAGASGFESDAVAFARPLDVECYRRTRSGFERAT